MLLNKRNFWHFLFTGWERYVIFVLVTECFKKWICYYLFIPICLCTFFSFLLTAVFFKTASHFLFLSLSEIVIRKYHFSFTSVEEFRVYSFHIQEGADFSKTNVCIFQTFAIAESWRLAVTEMKRAGAKRSSTCISWTKRPSTYISCLYYQFYTTWWHCWYWPDG